MLLADILLGLLVSLTSLYISVQIMFSLQLGLSCLLIISVFWTKLFGFSGSIFTFYLCFGLMLGNGELTTEIKHDDDS